MALSILIPLGSARRSRTTRRPFSALALHEDDWMVDTLSGREGAMLALLVALGLIRGVFELRHRDHWRRGGSEARRSTIAPLWAGGGWLVSVLLWVADRRLWVTPEPPVTLAGVGMALATGGGLLFAFAHRSLGARFALAITVPAGSPVRSGPYARIRHPMYAAGLLVVIGSTLYTGDALVAVTGLAYGMILVRRIPREDALLVEAFGEEHRRYVQRTPALIPSIRGR